jgi:Zn-finger domain-containing protein
MSELKEDGKLSSEAEVPKSIIPKAKLGEIKVTKYMKKCLDKVAHAEGFKNYIIKVIHGSGVGKIQKFANLFLTN